MASQKLYFHFHNEQQEKIVCTGEPFAKKLEHDELLVGEIVFTTGMTGIIETLTDPSFSNQILIITFPPFGNYGKPKDTFNFFNISEQFESSTIYPKAVLVDHMITKYSHWNAEDSLDKFLENEGVYGIKNIDTRQLTKTIRELGNMTTTISYQDKNENIYRSIIETQKTYPLFSQELSMVAKMDKLGNSEDPCVLFIDCGAKNNQLSCLLQVRCSCKVVSGRWNTLPTLEEIQSLNFKGIFLSNGPYDPKDWKKTLQWLTYIQKNNQLPIFGICLGHQLLALSNTIETYKMKYGNRGQNIPVKCSFTENSFITSQNHGYAVDSLSIKNKPDWEESFVNINDGSNEGMVHTCKPYFSVQFHPEAKPGPQDTQYLFQVFRSLVENPHQSGKEALLNYLQIHYPIPVHHEISRICPHGTILVLGSGGLSIGQAGEFDYSGSQALKSYKSLGYRTILINPNIATIQTDVADVCYINPITPEYVSQIIEKENVNYISLSFGGQTALNVGMQCDKQGIFEKFNVRVLGTTLENIEISEDRKRFKETVESIGLETPPSFTTTSLQESIEISNKIGFPLLVRAGFCLGGQGSGFAHNQEELTHLVERALSISDIVILDKSLRGWKELEYEIIRDCGGNVICVCSMENMDPLGVHTGESIVVAPVQTLNDREHQMLRSACFSIVHTLNIVGECNVQFALDPYSEKFYVIEMNARLSRSSALASKATGYPLASIGAKLGLGYYMHEIQNSLTEKTSAFFEPALDYVVVKIPRWDILKFPGVSSKIGSHMKSVGEVMAIGRTFPEAIMKAARMVGNFNQGMGLYPRNLLNTGIKSNENNTFEATYDRLLDILDYFWNDYSLEKIHQKTMIDNWFLSQLQYIGKTYKELYNTKNTIQLNQSFKDECVRLKKLGFSDLQIAKIFGKKEIHIANFRKNNNIFPYIKQIDNVAGEFPCFTNYLYLTYRGEEHDFVPLSQEYVLVLGSGVYRIGSSVEFDWCSVKCVEKLKEMNKLPIMLNYNPETVSTDYDMANVLFFEEISCENVDNIHHIFGDNLEGTILSVGGQIANNIATQLDKRNIRILGTQPKYIDMAENRSQFSKILDEIHVDQPQWSSLDTLENAKEFANRVHYPVLVRPSYVLSGAGMIVVHNNDEMEQYLAQTGTISKKYPVVISKFIEQSKEIEVDAVAYGGSVITMGISEHIENAGIHSGDATLVFPAVDLTSVTRDRIELIVRRIAQALRITGPFNLQLLAKHDELKVIECNVRVSRSFPLVSKTSKFNLIHLATEMFFLKDDAILEKWRSKLHLECNRVGVKVAQFSHHRLDGADVNLGVEMTSTGEVAAFGENREVAYLKAYYGTGIRPFYKDVLQICISIWNEEWLQEILPYMENNSNIQFFVVHTKESVKYTGDSSTIQNITEEQTIERIQNKNFDIVMNIPSKEFLKKKMGFSMRRACLDFGVPLLTNIKCCKLFLSAIKSYKKEATEVKTIDIL